MKNDIIETIIANSGEVTRESTNLLEAVFPADKVDKAVHVYFKVIEDYKQKAVLSGGNKLAVYIQ